MTQLPLLFQGEYTAGRRRLEYWTACPRCARLEACRKRRAPVKECGTSGWIRFCFADGTGGVTWSGVITLKDVGNRVREYLEVEEEDLPDDVAVPLRQMAFEELAR